MFARSRHETIAVDWGNGSSFRLLVEQDGLGFALAHTVVKAGTESRLQYRNHFEACYCISGSGSVVSACGTTVLELRPGVVYALDQNDPHILRADPTGDMELVSVFNPPIRGDERHVLTADGFSHY